MNEQRRLRCVITCGPVPSMHEWNEIKQTFCNILQIGLKCVAFRFTFCGRSIETFFTFVVFLSQLSAKRRGKENDKETLKSMRNSWRKRKFRWNFVFTLRPANRQCWWNFLRNVCKWLEKCGSIACWRWSVASTIATSELRAQCSDSRWTASWLNLHHRKVALV